MRDHDVKAVLGGLDRLADVDGVRLGHLRELLLGRRVDGRESLLAVRLDHLAADEQAIARLDADVVDRLGRGGVLEGLLGEVGGLPLGDRHQSIVK